MNRRAAIHIDTAAALSLPVDRAYVAAETGLSGAELERAINAQLSDFCMASLGATSSFLHASKEGYLKRAARYEKT